MPLASVDAFQLNDGVLSFSGVVQLTLVGAVGAVVSPLGGT